MPVRSRAAITARKLWDEGAAIRRTLVWGRLTDGFRGKEGWLLRKGSRRRYWKWDGRTIRPSRNNCGAVTTHGTPAPRALVKRMDDLQDRACAMWKEIDDSLTRKDRIKDLMHTFGGPVADYVFFNAPLEAPRYRCRTPEEMEARNGIGPLVYLCAGNGGAGGDFRSIRRQLKLIDDSPSWKETRERYRRKAEQLVRKHKTDIERVAKALLKRKTLTGAEAAKLIKQGSK
jgi:hypothetical protein